MGILWELIFEGALRMGKGRSGEKGGVSGRKTDGMGGERLGRAEVLGREW